MQFKVLVHVIMTVKERTVCRMSVSLWAPFFFFLHFRYFNNKKKLKSSYDIANKKWWFKMFYMMFLGKIINFYFLV